MKYILVFGNPADGFEHIGPFDSAEEASAYAERWLDGDWWTVLLQEPAREENDDE